MIKRLLFSALLLAAATTAHAQHAGAFSRLGFGARGIALGGALAGDGLASPYYNPAHAPYAESQHVEASAALMSFDRSLQTLVLATPMRPRAGIAAGLVHAAVTDIDGRDNDGYHTGELSTDEFAFFLAFGLRLSDRLAAGIGLQLFRSDLLEGVDAVQSVGLDFGLSYRVTDALQLGIVADDLLARYEWDTASAFGDAGKSTTDAFPRRIRLGASYRTLDGRLLLLAEYETRTTSREARTSRQVLVGDAPIEVVDVDELTLQSNRLGVGAEYRIADPLVLRAGVDRLAGDAAGDARPTLGFGIAQPLGALDVEAGYTIARERLDLGVMHVVSLRVNL